MTAGNALRPVLELAAELDLRPDEVASYGPYKAKVSLAALDRLPRRPGSKYVCITAVTPTPLGEGKTVNTIGLALGLNKIGKRAICTLRQPSMGPVFGLKGGATGGGASQVLPPDEINLHLTGDFHAVTAAHNLLAAAVDASLFHGNPLGLDLEHVSWRRVMDVNDRALRHVRVGLGGPKSGVPRDTGFDITAASEVMSMLTLATGLEDLRARLGRTVVGETLDGDPVTAEDLGVAGAMAAVMVDAIRPTLLQTSEGTPALLHSGPFANLGPGNSSILADRLALGLADFVVTEAGFAADLGLEKFCDLKCRASGLTPDAVGLVATVRALKVHSGRFQVSPSQPLDPRLVEEDLESLAEGLSNLEKQIENVRRFGVPVVVAVNLFGTESQAEIELVCERALAAGAFAAVPSDVFARGGEGGVEFAEAIAAAADQQSEFHPLYELDLPLRDKIEVLATQLYGAASISLGDGVAEKLDRFERHGWGRLPICMAKTHLSISHDPRMKGWPKNYVFPIVDVRAMIGAGYVTALAGTILTMPGLGREPGFKRIDVGPDGTIHGLS